MSSERPDATDYPVPDTDYSAVVVDAVADAIDTDATEISDRLYDEINPDALDSIFADKYDGTQRPGGQIIFTICGCEVVVDGGGLVTVTRIDDVPTGTDGVGTTVD